MHDWKDVKATDVFRNDASGRKAKVREVSSEGWVSYTLLATQVDRSASTRNFVKGRTLIERDGKPVERMPEIASASMAPRGQS